MPRPAYGWGYQKARETLLADGPVCVHCQRRAATEADHQPPLALHHHVQGTGCCVLLPSCTWCRQRQAAQLSGVRRPARDELVEPDGFGPDDVVWDVPWLDDLRDVPDDATWPRR